jgi:hypothetical protein
MITIGAESRLFFGEGKDTLGPGSSVTHFARYSCNLVWCLGSNNTVHKPVIAHGSLSRPELGTIVVSYTPVLRLGRQQ